MTTSKNIWKRIAVAAAFALCAFGAKATEGVADKWAIIGGASNNQYNWYEVDDNGEPVTGGWVIKVNWDSSLDRITICAPATQGTAGVLDFTNTDLVKINDSVNVFKSRTFITEVRFPDKFENLGQSAFNGCTGLTNVSFGANSQLIRLGGSCFNGCTSLRTVTPLLPEGVRDAGSSAFQSCPVEGHLRLGYGATSKFKINERMFQYSHQLESIDIGPMVSSIEQLSFYSTAENTTLKSVKLSEGITYMGNQVFYNCKGIETFVNPLPSTLTSLTTSWQRSSIPEIRYDLPSLYNERMFENCNSLERAVFGPLFSGAFNYQCMFNGASSFKYIDFEGDVIPQFTANSTFNGRNSYQILVTVPADGANWAAVLADPAQVTPWNGLSPTVQANFTANFPGDPEPLGLIIANWGTKTGNGNTLINQWITTDTKGVWAKANYSGSQFVVDVKLDTAKLSSADIYVQVTAPNAAPVETLLASGFTSTSWISYQIPGLAADTTYDVKLVVKQGGDVYGVTDLGGIYTGTLTLTASGSLDVANDGDVTVTVTRGTDAAAPTKPLTLKLDVSGSAVEGEDYAAFIHEITIPSGESSATLTIKSLYNHQATADRTLTLAIADSGCITPASVNITAEKPVLGWIFDSTAKTLTEVVDSGTAWVIPVNTSGTDLTLKAPTTVGTSTVLDFRKVIATADGVKYQIVTSADQAFKNLTTVTEIYLPESMTTVYSSFMNGCTELRKVRLSSKLKTIGGSAFYNCYNLREVLPSLLPDTVTSVGGSAFYNCYRLQGDLRIGFQVSPAGDPVPVDFSGTQIFRQCRKLASVSFGPGVTSIGNDNFISCDELASVTLPANLVSIGSSVFSGCSSLVTVTPFLPRSVKYLGGQAFYNCTSLEGDFEAGIDGKFTATDSGEGMFYRSQITSAKVLNTSRIPNKMFRECRQLASVTLDDTPTAFGSDVFMGCKALTEITLPANLVSIGSSCFSGCSALVTVTPFLPATLNSIGQNAFYNCNALEGELRFALGLPAASFGGTASFQYCYKITKVYLGDAITSIPNDTFSSCSAIEYVKLPTNLVTFGTGVFNSCSKLRTVEPFLPVNVTKVDGSDFYNCPIENDLYYATNGVSAKVSGQNTFKGVKSKKAVFGDNVTEIGQDAFNGNSSLEYVVLPKNLEKFNSSGAFANCSNLKYVENLLPETMTSFGSASFQACTKLNLPVKFWPASAAATGNYQFYLGGAGSVTEVDFGANVTSVGSYFLDGTKSVRRVIMRNNTMTWGSNSFNGWNNYQCAFIVHRDRTTWNGTAIGSVITPWADITDPAVRAQYTDRYPAEPDPRGLIMSGKYPAYQWIVSYGVVTPGVKNLMINGTPDRFGAAQVSPTYGTCRNISVPMNVSAPRYVANDEGNILYLCAGYTLEDSGDYEWVNPVTNLFAAADERTVCYTTANDGDRRLTWLWEPAAYSVSVAQPAASIGSVTISEGSLQGFFAIGETATLTAVDGTDGSFVCWHGDVPEGRENDRVLEVVIDGPMTITPEFSTPWTYDSSSKTITDGFWTLNATRSGSAGDYKFSVGKPVTGGSYAVGLLDLTKPIAGGGSFTEIANSAFENNNDLVNVRLPSTLTKIGSSALRNCPNLETVMPFLPPSVVTLGDFVFYNSTKLVGELTLAGGGGNVSFTNGDQFKNTAITKLTLGPDVTKIPNTCFYGCSQLKSVTLNEVLTSIGSEAFRECSELETVEPMMPAALTTLSQGAFYKCSKLGGTAYIGTNGVAVTLGFTSYGIFQNSAIDEIVLGPGVTSIPASFVYGDKALKRVTMCETVTGIGNSAFRECSNVTNIVPIIPASLNSLGCEVFYGDSKLSGEVHLGTNGVVTLGMGGSYGAFRGTAITNVHIGAGVRDIPNVNYFYGCSKLERAVFDDGGVTNLGNSAFASCSKLKYVKLPSAIERIRAEAFSGCSALVTVEPFLPETLTRLDNRAFYNCSALTTPLVLESAKVHGVRPAIDFTNDSNGNHFNGCSKIPSLTIGEISEFKNSTFYSMKGVKEVYIKSRAPFNCTGSNIFESWNTRQSRWHVPKTGWESWLTANVQPWAQVSPENKDYYRDAYPGEKPPYGLITSGYQKIANQWVVLWNPYPVCNMLMLR